MLTHYQYQWACCLLLHERYVVRKALRIVQVYTDFTSMQTYVNTDIHHYMRTDLIYEVLHLCVGNQSSIDIVLHSSQQKIKLV